MTEALLSTAPAAIPLTVNGHTFRMVPIEGGEFYMGDEVGDLGDACRPVHRVRLSPYSMGQFPVTRALWLAVMGGENPSRFKGDMRPVDQVSWDEAKAFTDKLNEKLPDWGFRLPTEAEWEYAARGGALGSSHSCLYAGSNRLESVGWWRENGHDKTNPVGLKMPNVLGLFDMSGNVWEWCADWCDGEFYEKCKKKGTVEDPRNDEEGSIRVLRGGSWFFSDPRYCRVASRDSSDPGDRGHGIGFRLAALPPVQWR